MANKNKRDELWCQYGIQLHPRRMHNVVSGPESAFLPAWWCHTGRHINVTGDTTTCNWNTQENSILLGKLNLHEMSEIQFCCHSVSCVMGWYQLTTLAQQWRWRYVFSSTLIWWPDDTWLEPWQKPVLFPSNHDAQGSGSPICSGSRRIPQNRKCQP